MLASFGGGARRTPGRSARSRLVGCGGHHERHSDRASRPTLRRLELHDDEFILELLNEDCVPAIHRRQGRTNAGRRARIHLEGSDGQLLALRLRIVRDLSARRGTPIGICGLVKRDGLADVDVGFAFLSRHWSMGYAVESAPAVLDYGRRALRLQRIVAITAPDNLGSIAVLEKIGLKFERMISLERTARSSSCSARAAICVSRSCSDGSSGER